MEGVISMTRVQVAIGLISAAIIAFQLALMQMLSYVQWYHFAYMIISIALLGFGVAGTFLTLFQKKLEQKYFQILPLLSMLTALLIPTSILLANSEPFRFDSLLIFQDIRQAGKLIITYFIFFLPFFTGALAIGLSFLKFDHHIGKIYFSNLMGSAVGGIMSMLLMQFFFSEQQTLLIAGLALASGFVSFPRKAGRLLQSAALASTLVLILLIFFPPKLQPSEFKDIRKTLLLPEANIDYEKGSPCGLVQVVSSPVLRFAPGVSLSFHEPFPIRKAVFNNGNFTGYLVPASSSEKINILDYTPQSLPYFLERIDKVLLLDAGTGENISLALSHQVDRIFANESNVEIFHLLQHSFNHQPNVKLYPTMARTFLATDTTKFDLIELPILGSFFGNSGLNAVEPRYELTIEALQAMWEKLSDNGMISLGCWMDYPVRNAYRVLSTLALLFEKEGIGDLTNHLIVIRSWSALTFLVKKPEFTKDEMAGIFPFCNDRMFDPLILPGEKKMDRGKYNLIQDSSFFKNMEKLLSPARNAFLGKYRYRVQPTTDDRPFFFQNIRWREILKLTLQLGNGSIPFMEVGYLLIVFTFVQIVLMAGIFILLPVFFKSWKSKNKKWVLIYFSGIGLAYMFIEMVFIQQFTFYFGQATYAAAATIGILLFASGIGSYCSGFLSDAKRMRVTIPVIIALFLLLYSIFLSPVLSSTIGASVPVKILMATFLLGVPGFLLGLPFPMGIRYLSQAGHADIPWAWAFNGYFSVISSALATIISVEAGYLWLLVIAAIIYTLAGVSNFTLKNP